MPTGISYYVDETWSPVVGCTKISDGCKFCWAEKMAARLASMECANLKKKRKYVDVVKLWHDPKIEKTYWKGWNGRVFCDEKALDIPLHWRKPRRILVPSMGDLFNEKVPFEFIDKVVEVAEVTPWHTYLFLTKRPERMGEYVKWRWNNADQHTLDCKKAKKWKLEHNIDESIKFVPNVHLGVTICTQKEADEILPIALQIPGFDWVSFEPMLEDIKIPTTECDFYDHIQGSSTMARFKCPKCGKIWDSEQVAKCACIDWVVVGGESGPKARPMHPDWARGIRDQCVAAGVPFYFKQWGEWLSGADKYAKKINTYQHYFPKRVTRIDNTTFFRVGTKKAGRLLDGKEWNQFPKDSQVRETI